MRKASLTFCHVKQSGERELSEIVGTEQRHGARQATNGKRARMKMARVLLAWLCSLTLVSTSWADVRVRGYYRKDGTYVAPHYRSSPDGSFSQ